MNKRIYERFTEIKSDRLILRELVEEDRNDLFEVLSDTRTCRYLTHNQVSDPTKIDGLIKGIRKFFQEEERIRWGINSLEYNKVIGHCGFFSVDEDNETAEISYCLKSDYWGNGFMTEALDKMIEFGFEEYGLNKIIAKVVEDNVASSRTLEKLGFTREGIAEETFDKNGESQELIQYSLKR